MALRGVWQLQKLVVNYCDWGGSSRGIRAFMESHLPSLKEKNPQLEVVTQLIRGQHPNLKGIYTTRAKPRTTALTATCDSNSDLDNSLDTDPAAMSRRDDTDEAPTAPSMSSREADD